jgi:hypothetical protein
MSIYGNIIFEFYPNMRKLILSICIALPLLGGNELLAQKAKPVAGSSPKITEATARRTLAGRRESESVTEYRFVMTWNSNTPPTAMFWRPNKKTWMPVELARPERKPMFQGSSDYSILEKRIKPEDVKKGDNIIVTTRHAHSGPLMPSAVKAMPVQSLYYQTKGSAWNTIKVSKLSKLPDVILP